MKPYTETQLRELDAWIAEHVMGWTLCGHLPSYWKQKDSDSIHFLCEVGSDDKQFEWNPTENKDHAFQVLEKCGEQGVLNGEFKLPVSIFRRGDKQWVVSENFEDEDESSERRCIVVEDPTLELAIVLFAQQLFGK